jgi:predicted RNA binding protein YcfA (HicA-like mRNA interferase family)
MIKRLTFGDLEATLEEFGYVQRTKAKHKIYEHPEGTLMIVLPGTHSKAEVAPMHQKIVEKTIRNDGVINWDDFNFFLEHRKRREDFIVRGDHLIWKAPHNGRETKVIAASAEEDGVVIIKQQGAFSPCPVNQLRKAETVEH